MTEKEYAEIGRLVERLSRRGLIPVCHNLQIWEHADGSGFGVAIHAAKERNVSIPSESLLTSLQAMMVVLNKGEDVGEIELIETVVWPSLACIHLKCSKPLVGSGGYHWWYNDAQAIEEAAEAGREIDYLPIVCKSCGLKLRLDEDAPDYPDI